MSAAPTGYRELAEVLDNLPSLVREARRARGLSLRAASKQSGITFTTLMRVEKGEGVTVTTAVAVLRWLDQT